MKPFDPLLGGVIAAGILLTALPKLVVATSSTKHRRRSSVILVATGRA